MWVYYCMENWNKVGRSELFSKKNIYGINERNMAEMGDSPYDIEQEGNHGWPES